MRQPVPADDEIDPVDGPQLAGVDQLGAVEPPARRILDRDAIHPPTGLELHHVPCVDDCRFRWYRQS